MLVVSIMAQCTIGFVYAGSVRQYFLSQDKNDVARIVLPPALPLGKSSVQLEAKGQADRQDVDKGAGARGRVDQSLSLVANMPLEQARDGTEFANGKISVLPVGAQLRSGPGFGHPRIMVVKGGLRIQIINTQGDWIHVRFPSGRRGYVHSSLVDEP